QRQAGEREDILEIILHNAIKLLNAVAGYIGLFDDRGKNFYIHYGIGIDRAQIMQPQPGHIGIQGQVYSTGKICYIAEYRAHPKRSFDKTLK
ncbi:GAF domain-containing protein, partial [Klebsiella pneumoniae]|nr:GAF domain-containing protein [Klebsiella pneumoniae]